mmetsp:Transcript_28102/g.70511  ORF Transcript_28102/g.70511 Transcript_28102/m.70511 type:complete len:287 (+) Transcript_28102:1371-2231(+)
MLHRRDRFLVRVQFQCNDETVFPRLPGAAIQRSATEESAQRLPVFVAAFQQALSKIIPSLTIIRLLLDYAGKCPSGCLEVSDLNRGESHGKPSARVKRVQRQRHVEVFDRFLVLFLHQLHFGQGALRFAVRTVAHLPRGFIQLFIPACEVRQNREKGRSLAVLFDAFRDKSNRGAQILHDTIAVDHLVPHLELFENFHRSLHQSVLAIDNGLLLPQLPPRRRVHSVDQGEAFACHCSIRVGCRRVRLGQFKKVVRKFFHLKNIPLLILAFKCLHSCSNKKRKRAQS